MGGWGEGGGGGGDVGAVAISGESYCNHNIDTRMQERLDCHVQYTVAEWRLALCFTWCSLGGTLD